MLEGMFLFLSEVKLAYNTCRQSLFLGCRYGCVDIIREIFLRLLWQVFNNIYTRAVSSANGLLLRLIEGKHSSSEYIVLLPISSVEHEHGTRIYI